MKKLGKKADGIPGWGYVIALVIALLVIAFLIWLSVKSKGSLSGMIDTLRGLV